MSWSLSWSHAAKADLIQIWLYIAEENEQAADRLITRIETVVDRLADFPRSAPARHDIGQDIRGLTVGNYLVVYRVDEASHAVALLRVLDGRRDLSAIFANGTP